MRYSTAPKRAVEFFIQLDKLLFGDVLNSDIIVGDGKPVPYGEKWRLLRFKLSFLCPLSYSFGNIPKGAASAAPFWAD